MRVYSGDGGVDGALGAHPSTTRLCCAQVEVHPTHPIQGDELKWNNISSVGSDRVSLIPFCL